MANAIYVKPMTWAGKLSFYLGYQPSDPNAHPCHRLGSYFLVLTSIESARAVADSEARRMNRLDGKEWSVVECPHYIGYERAA